MTTTNPVTVRLSFTVKVDPEMWTLNYGVEGTAAIRADVKVYAENGVRDLLREIGVLIEDVA